ncbi:hypothetical protein FRC0290_01016 [Corynebacterium diphtheriae]|nr:hypothetical protein FRC0290_01016 [Corynebacterium diphtheriae]CAB1012478.1 hypothetical protein FRC0534_01045 [Corynebacterium diphtheriae]
MATTFPTAPLGYIAEIRPSNADKKSKKGEPEVRLCNYTDVYYNESITADLELMRATASVDQIDRLGVLDGDVLITKDSEGPEDIGQVAIIQNPSADMVCAYHLALLRPTRSQVHPKFLLWALKSCTTRDYWMTHSFGVTRFSLGTVALGSVPVPLPPLDTQRAIADYLDRETSEIDAMLDKLDGLGRLLEERRRLAHTELFETATSQHPKTPIWALFIENKRQNFSGETVLSIYRDYGVIPKDSRDDNLNRTPENLSSYQLVEVGDVVINKMKAWQGSIAVSQFRGIVSPDYLVASPLTEADPNYLHIALRAPQMIPLYAQRSQGIRPSQWRLYWEQFRQMTVPLPDLERTAQNSRTPGRDNRPHRRHDGQGRGTQVPAHRAQISAHYRCRHRPDRGVIIMCSLVDIAQIVSAVGSVAAGGAAAWAAWQSHASSRENERIAGELRKTIESVADAADKNAKETKELVKQTASLAEITSHSTQAATLLAETSRSQAIESARPKVVAFFTGGSAYSATGGVYLTIRNIGASPAYNLHVGFDAEQARKAGFLNTSGWAAMHPKADGIHLPPRHEVCELVLTGEPLALAIGEQINQAKFDLDALITYQGQLDEDTLNYKLPVRFNSADLYRLRTIPPSNP